MKGEHPENWHSHGHCCFIINEHGNMVRHGKDHMRWDTDSVRVSMGMGSRTSNSARRREDAQGFMLHGETS